MSVVDKYKSQGLVPGKDTESEVTEPGLGIEVTRPGQALLALIEERAKLARRNVLFRQDGIRRPPAASRNSAGCENECRQQGELGMGRGWGGGVQRCADTDHRQATVLHVHTDGPAGYG